MLSVLLRIVCMLWQIDGVVAAVDATKEKMLSDRFKLKGFPTVKYFRLVYSILKCMWEGLNKYKKLCLFLTFQAIGIDNNDCFSNGKEQFEVNERTADKIVEFMKE